MEYYFAPMEGLTDSVYRRLHHKFFSGVDKYYMPFFSPTVHRSLTEREARELPMADSESFTAVTPAADQKRRGFSLGGPAVRRQRLWRSQSESGLPFGDGVFQRKGLRNAA